MKQLPDIMTSVSFWAAAGTLWAAAGAWFTYAAAAWKSRQDTYKEVLNLLTGLEAELDLVSEWVGAEDSPGYLSKTRLQLVKEHLDWFNPSRNVFRFSTPMLNNLTNSPHASALGTENLRDLVMLNHSTRRLFENLDRYETFAMADFSMYQSVIPKFAAPMTPAQTASSTLADTVVLPPVHQIAWTPREQVYINHIFMMNEAIHQRLIGGADSADPNCLYKAFRTGRAAIQKFKRDLKPEEAPSGFKLLHGLAGALALIGLWEVLRWFEIL